MPREDRVTVAFHGSKKSLHLSGDISHPMREGHSRAPWSIDDHTENAEHREMRER
jgi:hypothetical protein